MPIGFFDASYGGVRLWISELKTPLGRRVVVHAPSSGGDFSADDRGPVHGVSTATLLFDWGMGEGTPRERFELFRAQVDGEPRTFVHPLVDSTRATIGTMDATISAEDDSIRVEVEIVPVNGSGSGPSSPTGAVASTGAARVGAAAVLAMEEFERLGRDTGPLTRARDTAERWTDPAVTPRQVQLDLASSSAELGSEAEELDDSIETWAAFKSVIGMGEQLRAAAEIVMTDGAATFAFRVTEAIGMRALMAAIYGGEHANRFYDLTLLGNDIADPGMLPIGTLLALPQRRAISDATAYRARG